MRSLWQFIQDKVERAKEEQRLKAQQAEEAQRKGFIAQLTNPDPRVIANAARQLGIPNFAEAVGPLIQVMYEETLARMLTSRGGGDSVALSIEKMRRGQFDEIKIPPYERLLACGVLEAAEQALIGIGAPAVPALIKVLEDPDSAFKELRPGVGEFARLRKGMSLSLSALSEVLEDPGSAFKELRREAAWTLGKLKAAEAVPMLTKVLTCEDSWLVARAEQALREIGGPEVEAALAGVPLEANRKKARFDGLVAQLRSEVAQVRAGGAVGLGELGDPAAVQPLVELMREESLRILAGTLGMFGNVFSAQRGWIANQAKPDPEEHERLIKTGVRRKAADALVRIGKPAVPALIQLLQDPDERFLMVREEAARMLGEIKATEAVGPLAGALGCGGDLAKLARTSLERIGGPEAEKALAEDPPASAA